MAFLVSALDSIFGGGQSLSVTNNILNSAMINATTSFSSECFSIQQGSQIVQINGASDYNPQNESNSGCTQCLSLLDDIVKKRAAVEQLAAIHVNYTPQTISDNIQTLMSGGSTYSNVGTDGKSVDSVIGPCQLMCQSIVVNDVNQNQKFQGTTSCQITDDSVSKIQQSMEAQIQQFLKNDQDVFGQAEQGLQDTQESVTNNISTVLSQNLTTSVVQNLVSEADSRQFFAVDTSTASLYVGGSLQDFQSVQTATLTAVNQVTNQLRQSSQYSISQSLLNKNDSIEDISNSLIGVLQKLSDVIEDVTTGVLIIVAAVILMTIFVVAGLYLGSSQFKSWMDRSGPSRWIQSRSSKTYLEEQQQQQQDEDKPQNQQQQQQDEDTQQEQQETGYSEYNNNNYNYGDYDTSSYQQQGQQQQDIGSYQQQGQGQGQEQPQEQQQDSRGYPMAGIS